MRKLLLTVVASCALVAFIPATALAHHHHSRGHHARVHHKRFGSDWSQSGSTQSGSTQSGSTNSGDTAGTIQSFSNGVLTIQLNNGSTVSGTVTGDTEIECRAPDMSSSSSWQGHDHGGDNSSGDNGSGNDPGDDQGQGDDNQVAAQSCDSSSLTPTTVVREAELNVSSGGAVWHKLELDTQSTPSTSTSSSSSSSDG